MEITIKRMRIRLEAHKVYHQILLRAWVDGDRRENILEKINTIESMIEEATEYRGVDLWSFIANGNTRAVYNDPKNPNLVIKVPIDEMARIWEIQSNQEFENFLYWQRNQDLYKELKDAIIPAKCYYQKKTWLLFMEKLTVIKWLKNIGIDKDWVYKIYDVF